MQVVQEELRQIFRHRRYEMRFFFAYKIRLHAGLYVRSLMSTTWIYLPETKVRELKAVRSESPQDSKDKNTYPCISFKSFLDHDYFKRTKPGASTCLLLPFIFSSWPSFLMKGRLCSEDQIQETYTSAPYLALVLSATVVASCLD